MTQLDPAPAYEVYALRYATQPDRVAREAYFRCEIPEAPAPQDYFVWAIRGDGRTIVVDTGFSASSAQKRGRALLRHPVEALARIGIDASAVRDVVLTHAHYDHAGNLASFPEARFHVQDKEMQYCTGRLMRHDILRRTFDVADVIALVRLLYEGRLVCHDGDVTLAPGVTLHLVGGHTQGQQVVRVATRRGPIVLASDGAHFWANLRDRNPFPILVDLGATLEAFALIERLVASPEHIIPGHDPAVLTRFPKWRSETDIVALHEEPL